MGGLCGRRLVVGVPRRGPPFLGEGVVMARKEGRVLFERGHNMRNVYKGSFDDVSAENGST